MKTVLQVAADVLVFNSTQAVAKLTQTVATAAGLPIWRLPMAYAYAQNAIPYQVLDSSFWRFDCDCFIHSMQSSMVPFGCASCHFRARCCCSKEHVSCQVFSGSRISVRWGRGHSHGLLTHFPINGPPDLTCITPIIDLPSSTGFNFHTPSRSGEAKQQTRTVEQHYEQVNPHGCCYGKITNSTTIIY